jgi:hypothetical protein
VPAGGTSCFIRAQRYARPSKPITYLVRYNKAAESNDVRLELPPGLTALNVSPAPVESAVPGVTEWYGVPGPSGSVKVTVRVNDDVPEGTLFPSIATVRYGQGGSASCVHESIVDQRAKLFAALKGNTKVASGSTLNYVARYRGAVGANRMTLTLPSGVSLDNAWPGFSERVDATLVWNDLPNPAGLVKVRVRADAPSGSTLAASLFMSDATGAVATGQHTASVR